VLFGAVLTDEGGPVRLGELVTVMEHAVVRGRAGNPALIGRHSLVGPHAHVNGAELGDGVFVATGAAIFAGARLGDGAEVRIRGVVHVGTRLEAGAVVPIGWVAVGDPAEILPPDRHERIWEIQRGLDFPKVMYGVERREDGGDPAAMMAEIAARSSAAYGRHLGDRVIAAE
jgi:carbonic anhydrase/acetyltransferase-like protein (isoleucine patch superfamily)